VSVISLTLAKQYLDVIHSDDDVKLQMLLDGAEDEALSFLNADSFDAIYDCDSNADVGTLGLPSSVVVGVLTLLQARYQTAPEHQATLRMAAETILMPYRCGMGI